MLIHFRVVDLIPALIFFAFLLTCCNVTGMLSINMISVLSLPIFYLVQLHIRKCWVTTSAHVEGHLCVVIKYWLA